jgi:hypothetical protein
MTKYSLLLAAALLLQIPVHAADTPDPRWSITDDGGITWTVKRGEEHEDHIEMAGKRVAVIVTYGVDKSGALKIDRHVVWPMLRFEPNKTRDHLALNFSNDALPRLFIDRAAPRNPTLERVTHQDGITHFEGVMGRNGEFAFRREIFPSTTQAAVIDTFTLTNNSNQEVTVEFEDNTRTVRTNPDRGIYGDYIATTQIDGVGEKKLKPGESTAATLVISARKSAEPPIAVDASAEREARVARVASVLDRMQLETPDPVLNKAFDFAKIRAAESIYETKGGLMHGPGGGNYYAAIWANDQAEYANPFFAMLGDPTAAESAINSFRHFAKHMNPDYKPIPSSITSEGDVIWQGAKDRGDMAMIAYGAARFALAYGDRKTAEELWPLIEWCLEYSRRKIDANGVVASDSDELENRFPAGKANLCTSSLYYDALISAAALGRDLGKPASQLKGYTEGAAALRSAIEKHFGAKVEGFDTYRYYDKNDLAGHSKHGEYATKDDVLRAWICIPLTVGIHDRAEGTIDALFSPRLWTPDGLATEAGKETFWDRSTLYALRGVFEAGATQKALDYLTYYSNRRLLGDHVPYAIEAWPENNQRHLSAESALYARIFTEGIFGIRPTGFHSFKCTPRLPAGWDRMALKRVHAFGNVFDLTVTRASDGKLTITVQRDGAAPRTQTIADGESATINLAS